MPEKIMTKNVRRPAEMREKRATQRAGPLREINRAARPTHTSYGTRKQMGLEAHLHAAKV